VGQPGFFKEMSAMMNEVPVSDWKTYLRWHVVNAAAPWLSSAFVTENFRFRGEVMTGAKQIQPRWKRAIRVTDRDLGEALGTQYVKRYFPPAAKARALEMVENLRAAFRERLKTRAWMSDDTKSKALDKLASFRVKIGYPEKWRDYSALTIDRGSFIANLVRASEFEFKRNLDQIGQPVDRTEWGMTPPTVNAYYNPQLNEIVFPAGILQPPFFDPDADDAVNYGGMGAVIGHEMTHGFDDQGNKFDSEGNLKDWWKPVDRIAFDSRAHLLEQQYSDCVVVDTIHENGKLTLGENIADLGGLTIAFAALRKSEEGKPVPPQIDGFTPGQRLFPGMGADMEGELPGPGAPPPCDPGSACRQPPACQLSSVGHAGVPAGFRPEIRGPDGPSRDAPRQHLVDGGVGGDKPGPAAFRAAGPVDFQPPSP
jgi:putative endopeptidase